jgi:hypothetical protein
MDCKTARLLLDYLRPPGTKGGAELGPDEASALEGHLAHCPGCDELARRERQVDEQLGRAMRQVEVPPGLRDRLMARLEQAPAGPYRRWFGHGLRFAAAAAALLLLVGAWWVWWLDRPQTVDTETVVRQFNESRANPRDEAQAFFKRMGVTTKLPQGLDYACLTAPGLAELPGYPGIRVPQLVFTRNTNQAIVYVLPARRFVVKDEAGDASGSYKLSVRQAPGDPNTLLMILYNSEDLDWLLSQEPVIT